MKRVKKILSTIWFQPYTPVIVILLIVYGIYRFGPTSLPHFIRPSSVEKLNTSDKNEASESASVVIAKVGKLIDLPQDEEPQIIHITDIDKFKDQPFFK